MTPTLFMWALMMTNGHGVMQPTIEFRSAELCEKAAAQYNEKYVGWGRVDAICWKVQK